MAVILQKTIKKETTLAGVGLHSGAIINLTLKPAEVNSGIVFKRTDLGGEEIRALYSNVVDTRLCTLLGNEKLKISTIEHLMAALWLYSIDNVVVELNGAEVPIMDGSAKDFVELLENAGTTTQEAPKKFLKICQEVEITEGDRSVKITPDDNFSVDMTVDFPYGGIGKQNYTFTGDRSDFKNNIMMARTFCNSQEIEYLRANGLARGGSLDNAMVFDDKGLLNENGYRCDVEVVKHKIIDCVGDMLTAGYEVLGKITAVKSGHGLHNKLLTKIFKDANNYSIVE